MYKKFSNIGKIAAALALGLTSISYVNAQSVIKNGVKYTVTSAEAKTASAAGTDKSLDSITVLDKVEIEGAEYTVTSLAAKAFYQYNTNLVSISLPKTLLRIENEALYMCSKLKDLVLPENLEYMGPKSCYKLELVKKLVIPAKIKVIYQQTFGFWSALEELQLNEGLDSIGAVAFASCKKLTSVKLPQSLTAVQTNGFQNCTGLTSIDLGGVKHLWKNAFYGCTGLQKVEIPASVNILAENPFLNCTKLSEVNVSADNQTYVSVNGKVFSKDMKKFVLFPIGAKDTSFTLPESVTSIESGAFNGCKTLTELNLPAGLVSIEDYGLYQTGLTKLTLPENLTKIGNYACSSMASLAEITLGKNISEIGTSAFMSDAKLQKVNLMSVDNFLKIKFANQTSNPVATSGKLYFDNKEITEVVVPEGIETLAFTFYSWRTLLKVVLPESLKEIGNYTFYHCFGLTSIEIPAGVNSLGDASFEGCNALKQLKLLSPEPEKITTSAKAFSTIEYNNATLLVPSGKVELMKQTEPWKNFKSIEGYSTSGLNEIGVEESINQAVYFDLKGRIIPQPQRGNIYLKRQGDKVSKVVF